MRIEADISLASIALLSGSTLDQLVAFERGADAPLSVVVKIAELVGLTIVPVDTNVHAGLVTSERRRGEPFELDIPDSLPVHVEAGR